MREGDQPTRVSGSRISLMGRALSTTRTRWNCQGFLMEETWTWLASKTYPYLMYENSGWIKYTGQFKDDNKHGYGTLYLNGNRKFEGQFQGDIANGNGEFNDNGRILRGLWRNNRLI